jgi:hypothetical protein
MASFHFCFLPHWLQNALPSGSIAPQFVQNDAEGLAVLSSFSFIFVDVGLAVRRLEATNRIATATTTMIAITTTGSV